ncbi:hypothetical protein K7X08_034583 [Anisodus acutangulus]|uniref:Uncharacterized protein n=1 Tax=Anisodus acutangulus TaxID=402998 RepID=A0A9Q1LFM8_9SOLA|nr:hypothetical protein K7X08_034583 [Anisodus acutangulus]
MNASRTAQRPFGLRSSLLFSSVVLVADQSRRPGKKMPGRLGGVQLTVKNVWVYKIDPARNLMWVKDQVP